MPLKQDVVKRGGGLGLEETPHRDTDPRPSASGRCLVTSEGANQEGRGQSDALPRVEGPDDSCRGVDRPCARSHCDAAGRRVRHRRFHTAAGATQPLRPRPRLASVPCSRHAGPGGWSASALGRKSRTGLNHDAGDACRAPAKTTQESCFSGPVLASSALQLSRSTAFLTP